MKILLICPRSPRLYSAGLEVLTINLAKSLASRGNTIEIAATGGNLATIHEGIVVREHPSFSSNPFGFIAGIFNEVKNSNAEIVHINGYNNIITPIALIAKRPGQKVVLYLGSSVPNTYAAKILRFFYDKFFRLVAWRIDFAIYSCDEEKEEYSKFVHDAESATIPNGTDIRLVRAVKVKKRKGRIVSSARLIKSKGMEQLIRGFGLALMKRPDAELHILGDGPEKNTLLNIAKDLGISGKVFFHGEVMDRKAYVAELKKSEALVFLANYAGVSLTFLEAFAAGMPVIVRGGIMKSMISKGWLVPVGNADNPEDVSSAICAVLDNPDEFVAKNPPLMSWEEYGMEILRIYKKIVGRN